MIEELDKTNETIKGIYQLGTQPYLYVATSGGFLKLLMESSMECDEYTIVKRLQGMKCSGCFLQLNEKQLLIGGEDKIYLFRISQFGIEEEIKLDGVGSISQLIKCGDKVLFASDNGVIGIYDVSSKDIALYYTEMKITKIIKQSEAIC